MCALVRTVAHATNVVFYTFPWGSPREALTEPESSITTSLEHSAAGVDHSLILLDFGRPWPFARLPNYLRYLQPASPAVGSKLRAAPLAYVCAFRSE
jgi:hypothetical protein